MLTDREFHTLLNHYQRSWPGYRKVRKGPMKRISGHMKSLGCRSVEEYLDTLADNPAEEALLFSFLRITISRFFRDRKLWASLTDRVFPFLLQRTDNLKIWSAGCSCGEEVYSLCILHHIHWADFSNLEIMATDANRDCLERARKGVYPKSSLREVDSRVLAKYFTPAAGHRNEYLIQQPFDSTIHWMQHDLFSTPPDKGFHLIMLRNNLLTYHSPEVQSLALSAILQSLHPEGFLITGSHETLPNLNCALTATEYCDMIYHFQR